MSNSDLTDQLADLAARAAAATDELDAPQTVAALARLDEAIARYARAWSGSNLGYHSCVYYAGVQPPPSGAHFDAEWGFLGTFQGTTGDWHELPRHEVLVDVLAAGGFDSLEALREVGSTARSAWRELRDTYRSIVTVHGPEHADPLIASLEAELDKVADLAPAQALQGVVGSLGSRIVRDTTALSQGWQAAPHQQVEAELVSIRSAAGACRDVGRIASRSVDHLDRLEKSRRARGQGAARAGDRVFIGHGRSAAWRELKDFIARLGTSYDEFNRVPVAGVTNIARLSDMLDVAAVALIVLTAEDEQLDGTVRARQNVVHEAGLFQGRLGFTRAIVVLEEGCEEFSNIQGLGQIRFPAGRISAAFEEIRTVLEREELL